mgnify:FL=1
MNQDWGRELQSIIEDIDSKNVKEVMNYANQSYEKLNRDSNTRNKENYPLILNDIIKLEVERIYYTNHKNDENKPKKWEDHDLFIPTKNNFSANFKKFCLALGIDSENFKIGKSYAFKSESKSVLHDILLNNPEYIHFLKYGVNKKDLKYINKINENLYYFIKNEITDQQDYAHAMTVYYLYFLIDSNIEIGIKSKIIEILTATGITNNDRISLLEYYLDELDELDMEINAKLAESIETNQTSYLIQNDKTAIHFPLAKYITHRDTKASVPKNMLLSLILNSDLVPPEDLEDKELKYPKKITKEHHDKLVNEINKALNHYNDNDNPPSDYFYITSN